MPLGFIPRIYKDIFGTNPEYQPIPVTDLDPDGCLTTHIDGCSHVEHIPARHADSSQVTASAINSILDQNRCILLILRQITQDIQALELETKNISKSIYDLDIQIPIDFVQVLQEINLKTSQIETLKQEVSEIKTQLKNQDSELAKLTKAHSKLTLRLDSYLPDGNISDGNS